MIIAVSESTKKDVIEAYCIPEEKVRVVYSGIYPENAFTPDNSGKVITGLEGTSFLLSVSAVGANKNQGGMIRAFMQFKIHHPESNLKLVLCGPIRQYDVIRKIEDEYGDIGKEVVFTGFVSDDELAWLYHSAIAFIYVSFYEGFGLPILEALSAGRAVICSNTSSMPEVGGDAAEYCDPYDVDSIEVAITNVVMNEQRKSELESAATMQAAKFSYEKTAKETLEIYRSFE